MTAVHEHQLSFRDAMLPATVRQADYTAFMSEDKRLGRCLGGMVSVNPFAPDASAVVATMLDT